MTLSTIFEHGYFKLARVRGVPIRIHWLTPLVLWALAEFRFIPGWWLGILTVVLVHELGHAVAVWTFRAEVLTVDLLPFGGECGWRGEVTRTQRAIIAWGGVCAQAVLWACTVVALAWLSPHGGFQRQLVHAFTDTNLMLIGLNLLPVRPLDGAEAWRLLAALWHAGGERKATALKMAARRDRLQEQIDAADKRADALDAAAARAIDEALARRMNVKVKVKPGGL